MNSSKNKFVQIEIFSYICANFSNTNSFKFKNSNFCKFLKYIDAFINRDLKTEIFEIKIY